MPNSDKQKNEQKILPQSQQVCGLDDGLVPHLDEAFAGRDENVRTVLRAGEALRQNAELVYSPSESNVQTRCTTKRDGREVEYEVVACTRKARKDLRVGVDADPESWKKLRAAVLCIGIGEYTHLPCLPNAARDAQALCEQVNTLQDCKAQLLVDDG